MSLETSTVELLGMGWGWGKYGWASPKRGTFFFRFQKKGGDFISSGILEGREIWYLGT